MPNVLVGMSDAVQSVASVIEDVTIVAPLGHDRQSGIAGLGAKRLAREIAGAKSRMVGTNAGGMARKQEMAIFDRSTIVDDAGSLWARPLESATFGSEIKQAILVALGQS